MANRMSFIGRDMAVDLGGFRTARFRLISPCLRPAVRARRACLAFPHQPGGEVEGRPALVVPLPPWTTTRASPACSGRRQRSERVCGCGRVWQGGTAPAWGGHRMAT